MDGVESRFPRPWAKDFIPPFPINKKYIIYQMKRDTRNLFVACGIVLAFCVSVQPAQGVTPGGSNVYASLWTSNSQTPRYGIYSLDATGAEFVMNDPKGTTVGFPMRSGWVTDGNLCGYYVKENYSVLEKHYYIETAFPSGDVGRFDELSADEGYFFAATYNPDDHCIYGYGLTPDYSYALMKAPASNPGALQVVTTFEYDADLECLSIAYNTADQLLYGINAKAEFVKVNPATGAQTVVCDVPFGCLSMVSGMCYAPKENLFYWNALLSESLSAIYTVTVDGVFAKVMDCADGEQYNFLFCTDKATVAASPQPPVIKSVGFERGATSGSIVLGMPGKSVEGADLQGTLTWNAMLDGTVVKSGQASPSAEVTVEYAAVAEGNHVFAFQVFAGDAASERVSHPMYVGVDVPKAPASAFLDHKLVSWEAVTEGVNGGYVDLDNLEYQVSLNGEHAFNQPALNLYGYHQLADAELKRYTATVVAKAGSKVSAPAVSNTVALGTPLQPDFQLAPTAEDVDKMTVVDANADGRTWSYSIFQECAKSSFGSGIPMDDWLILSPVALNAGDIKYRLSIDVQTCNATYTGEFLRVCIADSPTPREMTRELIAEFNPERTIATYSCEFAVDKPGTYYIGFHNTSAADQEGILLSNIRIQDTRNDAIDEIEAVSPAADAEYYNLQGVRVDSPARGIYIERRGVEARKVIIF